ncbi:MAG TPA: hypothetical protein VF469_27705 [Kofleriaceae bacterium]
MPVEFPKPQVVALQDLAARLLDSRKSGGDLERLARDLLHGFFDLCARAGLDRVLVELEQAFPPLDSSERTALANHEIVSAALVAQLGTIKLDGGGPRNAKPGQVTDCVVAALGLTVVTEPDRSILLGDDVRSEVAAALGSVLDVELAVPQIRETIIAEARARCDESLHAAFAKIAEQLDERGLQLVKSPKVPIHALHAVQRALFEARNAVVERVARTAIDRAQEVLARTDADAAARIDLPITLRSTPREVAILRACDAQVSKTPAKLAQSLLDSLRELVRITWRAPERPVHPYAASRTFAVGDLIDHPKFGRGTVVSRLAQRIDVEFADGKHTLAHVGPRQ